MKKYIFILFLIFNTCFIYAETDSTNQVIDDTTYDDINFPQWTLDLRRTEIITFGSLPFVTLWTTFGYSFATYNEFRNPLQKNNGAFTEDDQKKVLMISACISLGLGVIDLLINLIQRSYSKKAIVENNAIKVIPITENTIEKDYLIEGVIEDAIF